MPVHAKPIYYTTNGSGRDTYIKLNNGGLTTSNNLSTMSSAGGNQNDSIFKFGGGNENSKKTLRIIGAGEVKSNAPNIVSINGRMNHYHSNGSGRDGYICVNSGGISSNDGTALNHNFHKNLRNYQKLGKLNLKHPKFMAS